MISQRPAKFSLWLGALGFALSVLASAPSFGEGSCEPLLTPTTTVGTGSLHFAEPADLQDKYLRVKAWMEAQGGRRTSPFLSIIVPAFREEARLPGSIAGIREFLNRFPLPVEVLLIIEKSPDRTVEVARAAAAGEDRIQVIDNQVQRGKGYAVRSGMARASGEVALFMDADLSTPLYEIINFLDWMRAHPETEVLIGDRVKAINSVQGARSPLRRLMTKTFKSLLQMVSPLDFGDTQAGFKAFRRVAREQIFARQSINGFAFDVEVLILAQELGLQAEAIDIDWTDDRRSTVRPIVDPIKMVIDILKIQAKVRTNLTLQTGE